MKRATIMLTVIAVLGSASLAAAECAWVLWTRVDTASASGSRTNWEADTAYENFRQCKAGRKEAIKQARRVWDEDVGIEREYVDEKTGEKQVVIEFQVRPGKRAKHVRTVYYRCLPETIDPRERKK